MACSCVEVQINKESSKNIFLPCDLFIFQLSRASEIIDVIIKFIDNLAEKKGYYFNSHYMHEVVKISEIEITIKQAPILLNYQQAMKSIKVASLSNNNIYFIGSSNLNDRIVIETFLESFDYTYKSIMRLFINNQTDEVSIKDIPFNWIKFLDLQEESDSVNKLRIIWGLPIWIKYLLISGESSKNLESMTDPDILKWTIDTMEYLFCEDHFITDKTFENINKLNLNVLLFRFKYPSCCYYNNAKIISNLPK